MRRFLPLALLLISCAFIYDFANIPDPEGLATDAFGTPPHTTLPSGSQTPAPPPLPTPTPPHSHTPTPGPTPLPILAGPYPFTLDQADDAQAALRPEFAADVALLPDASRYVLDVAVTFNPDGTATLAGRALIRYTNRESFPLRELYLMLWPNERFQYLGSMTLGRVAVAGTQVIPTLEQRDLAARLPLADPLPPGGVIELEAEFTTHARPGLENGARFGLTNGVLIAPGFYPLIPRLVDGAWQVEPPPLGGDTTNSDSAFYAWRVTAPAGLLVAASGEVVDQQATAVTQTVTLLTGPMRDLALVVGDLEVHTREAGGVRLNAYLLPRNRAQAADVLSQAAAQLELLQDRVGPYPYTELDIVDAPGAFGGIEYPGLILIGVINNQRYYETANVHEVGHQWFYGLIGDDQLLEPWLDEGAASYTEVLYAEHVYGARAAQSALDDFWRYLASAQDPTQPIGRPVDGYNGDYYAIVYGKGALFFDALRRELGDETFFDFLRAYYAEYRYGFATSRGFHASAEAACACELDDLFDLWVYKGGEVKRP